MATFEIGTNENIFLATIKAGKSVVFTETFFKGDLERIKDTDKTAPLSYLRDGASATVVVALPLSALNLKEGEEDKVQGKNHNEIKDAVNAYQKAKGGVCFEFRSLFNGSISLLNLVNKAKEQTSVVPDNGLHTKDCNDIKKGIEDGTIVSTYYKKIYRLKNGDCRPIRCYALASMIDEI